MFYQKDITTLRSRLKKECEIFFQKQTLVTIIQDSVRGKTLLQENRIKETEMVYVPNTFLSKEIEQVKNGYLHKKYSIPVDKRIIIMAGGIGDWTMSNKIAQAARTWPEEWILIIHGEGEKDYIDELRSTCEGTNIIISDKMVPYKKLNELVGSADIGLALYENWHQGIFEMSKASGKIWQYLRCGLPVVSMNFPSLVELIEGNECGVCVNEESEVRGAIKTIISDYNNYSSNADNCFYQQGDFKSGFNNVLKIIEDLDNSICK